MSEMLEIVNERGEVVGTASRSECHRNPELTHCTAHVVVWSSSGQLLLQKRSVNKDMFPGKWDTAVGGHLEPGESYEAAAARELEEELGIGLASVDEIRHLFDMSVRHQMESERVRVFRIIHDGPFFPPAQEIEELRFWSVEALTRHMNNGTFTPGLDAELARILPQQDAANR